MQRRRRSVVWSWKVVAGLGFGVGLSLSVGCASKLETGYQPRRLGASENVRRAYYASPFTPEANAAALDREQELEARRPKPN
ncbi:MAG: hypothetical protein ACREIT_05415 [Tepidisphaeraceae bacterium]